MIWLCLYFCTLSRYSANRYEESSGPPLLSGWNCNEKIGRDLWISPEFVRAQGDFPGLGCNLPSFEESFKLTKNSLLKYINKRSTRTVPIHQRHTYQSPERVFASTAYPWFWLVISHRPVRRFRADQWVIEQLIRISNIY